MSLTKKVYLTVSGYDIKLSDNLTFYQKDQLKLIFYINEYGIDYENNATARALMPVNPLNAILFIENPDGVDSVSSAKIEDNAVTFYLDSTHTQYVGISRMQLRLFDQDGCAITLPHFTFEIRENIYGSGDVRFQNVVMVDQTGTVILTEDNDLLDVGDILTMGTEVAYPQVAKTIKELPVKHGLDGTEKLIVEDNEATKQAPLGTIVDEIKQNSQEKIREIESGLAQTNAQLSEKEKKKIFYISELVSSGDIANVIDEALQICYDNDFILDLSGEWTLTKEVRITHPIIIQNGTLSIPSFESDGILSHNVFNIQSDNVSFISVKAESVADRIPRINKRNGQLDGLASNVVFVTGENINNIYFHKCNLSTMTALSLTNCKNIKFFNSELSINEMGMYALQCRDILFDGVTIETSTLVNSHYYHAFYFVETCDFKLNNLTITTNDNSYPINDIFHFYNPSSSASVIGSNGTVMNVVCDGNFNRLAQLNLYDNVKFENITGDFNSHIIQLNRFSTNIKVSNSNFSIKNKLKTTAVVYATDFNDSNSCEFSNTTITVESSEGGGFLDTCNTTYSNCLIKTQSTLSVAKGLNAGYLKCLNVQFITPSNITDMFNGSDGKYDYINCTFDCNNTAQYVSYNFSERICMKVIGCFFTINKRHLFDVAISNPNTVVINSFGMKDGIFNKYEYTGVGI